MSQFRSENIVKLKKIINSKRQEQDESFVVNSSGMSIFTPPMYLSDRN